MFCNSLKVKGSIIFPHWENKRKVEFDTQTACTYIISIQNIIIAGHVQLFENR